MKRTLFIVAAVLGFATAAGAATLSVASDKLTYSIGETISLTVTGDSAGGKDFSIFGQLIYEAALTETVTSSQTQHTRGGGTFFATTGVLNQGDGFADVFNQIIDITSPRSVDQLQIATATLVAQLAGVVNVDFRDDTGSGFELDFFGLSSAPGTTFTIIPEPTTAALLGLGLMGLVLGGRRRS